MAPKREPAELRGNDKFGGDYSDVWQAKVVRSDAAWKQSARK